MEASSNADDQHHLKQQEEKLRAKYGGMIPKKNLIVSDRKHRQRGLLVARVE